MSDPLKQFAFAALDAEDLGGETAADMRPCDWEGCEAEGAHPAPRSRQRLSDRYWFCKEHAREYNRAWNYFAGMSAAEIEQERRKDTIWQRPTWPFSRGHGGAGGGASGPDADASARPRNGGRRPITAAECRAASTLGLVTPYTKASLKACYRERAKAAHPDLNPDDPHAEERFKVLREAYMTLLRPLST
ncbi:MAG: J domain-containing protein [Alphaproteobacteria bacterium]|nr:J domain-containing protein [Alphaproteobacteria bacterium]MCB9931469.1 J domain-containing protein [Alphaproteobacteria bacterium]